MRPSPAKPGLFISVIKEESHMKLIRKRIQPLLLMALLLIAALPMQALAAEGDAGWTQ